MEDWKVDDIIGSITISNRMLMYIDECVLKGETNITLRELLNRLGKQYDINADEHAFLVSNNCYFNL